MPSACQRKARTGVLDMVYLERRLNALEESMEPMPKKKLYQCAQCEAIFKGQVDYSYHMRAHIRVSLSPPPPPILKSPQKVPMDQLELW